jgi:Uma2 family endonuclease
MSQPAAQALDDDLPFDLVYSDGWPLDSNWERIQINLFIHVVRQAMAKRGQRDFFAAGDMFVYHSVQQARDVAEGRPYLRGPDVFFVAGVEDRDRKAWVSWQENGRLPDLIVEFLSPSTAKVDRTVKKDLYARIFRTPEYFLYEPRKRKLEGLRLAGDRYVSLAPDGEGRIWSEKLGLKLGLWQGTETGVDTTWVRVFDAQGRMVPTAAEAECQRADAERQRAETERQRADAAEAELARLRARLAENS